MQLVKAKCSECGAVLEIDKDKEAAICSHCGSAFIVEKAINNYNTTVNIASATFNYASKEETLSKSLMFYSQAKEYKKMFDESLTMIKNFPYNHNGYYYLLESIINLCSLNDDNYLDKAKLCFEDGNIPIIKDCDVFFMRLDIKNEENLRFFDYLSKYLELYRTSSKENFNFEFYDKTAKLIKKMRNDDLEEIRKLKIWLNETSKKKNIFIAITVVAILSTIITFALATEYAYLFIVVVILVITTIICSKNAKIYNEDISTIENYIKNKS